MDAAQTSEQIVTIQVNNRAIHKEYIQVSDKQFRVILICMDITECYWLIQITINGPDQYFMLYAIEGNHDPVKVMMKKTNPEQRFKV